MKCSAKDCKEEAVYVWIDAYLASHSTILSGELSAFPLCINHDTKLHEVIDELKIDSNLWLSRRIRIKERPEWTEAEIECLKKK